MYGGDFPFKEINESHNSATHRDANWDHGILQETTSLILCPISISPKGHPQVKPLEEGSEGNLGSLIQHGRVTLRPLLGKTGLRALLGKSRFCLTSGKRLVCVHFSERLVCTSGKNWFSALLGKDWFACTSRKRLVCVHFSEDWFALLSEEDSFVSLLGKKMVLSRTSRKIVLSRTSRKDSFILLLGKWFLCHFSGKDVVFLSHLFRKR
jgi:hypothetical protein